MAKTISQLPSVSVPNDADIFPVEQGGVTYKETRAQIVTAEAVRATAAEGVLTAAIVAEASTRGTNDTTNANNLITETNNRIAADATLTPLSYLDTDGTLAANSDSKIATQKASKTAITAIKTAAAKTLESFDASGNVFPPTYGGNAIKKGDRWYIIVGGTLGTQTVVVGNVIEALIDTAIVEADFAFFSLNVVQATTSVQGVAELATSTETKALTDTSRIVVPSTLGDVLGKYVFQRTEVAATPFTATEVQTGVLGVTIAGAVTVNLPAIAAMTSKSRTCYTIVDERGTASAGIITVVPNGSETINGTSSYRIYDNFGSIDIYNNGTNWFIKADKNIMAVGAGVRTNAAKVIPTGVATKVDFDIEDYDYQSSYDSVTNFRYTAPIAGAYLVLASGGFEANATGFRKLMVHKNGDAYTRVTSVNNGAGDEVYLNTSRIVMLAVNDYIEVFAYQNSGGDLDLLGGDRETHLQIALLSR